MAHTIKVIVAGFVLLAGCLLIGRLIGSANLNPSMAVSRSALVFIPLWAIAAGINMWMGVTKAGYSVKEEIPFFFIVFLIPAGVAAFIWWSYRGIR
jgi:hypothetical protein